MGRRLNLSTPTVINTELVPFDESFYIEANGQTEQWYYDNTTTYAPDRSTTPLILTPKISVFDSDTKTSLTPMFLLVRWFVNEYNNTANDYVETEITAVSDGDIDYFKSGNTLVVKKNVSYTRAITIECRATYIDPRDSGYTHDVTASVILSTNRDATLVFPKIDIACPSSISYNPLIDRSSLFTFNAVAYQGDEDVTNTTEFEWYAINGTSETLVDFMPWYVGGQRTSKLSVDAMWGEEIRIILRAGYKETSPFPSFSLTLYPDKVYRSLIWRIPDVDTTIVSDNGGAVRSSTSNMTFYTICNCVHRVLNETKKRDNLFFNWKARKSSSTTEIDCGWGQTQRIAADVLRNTIGSSNTLASTLVYSNVYIAGAYENITDDGESVTDDSEFVYDRPILV